MGAANLTAALDGDGPLTVFVPSNEAFAKLPKGTLDLLLDPKNVKELQDILKYHVIAGGALRAGCNLVGRPCGKGDLEIAGDAKPDYVYTLEGKAVTISQVPSSSDHDASIVIDKSYIVPFRSVPGNGFGSLDQIASNGIWHVIDQVLMPTTPVDQTLNQLIASKPDLSTFATRPSPSYPRPLWNTSWTLRTLTSCRASSSTTSLVTLNCVQDVNGMSMVLVMVTMIWRI